MNTGDVPREVVPADMLVRNIWPPMKCRLEQSAVECYEHQELWAPTQSPLTEPRSLVRLSYATPSPTSTLSIYNCDTLFQPTILSFLTLSYFCSLSTIAPSPHRFNTKFRLACLQPSVFYCLVNRPTICTSSRYPWYSVLINRVSYCSNILVNYCDQSPLLIDIVASKIRPRVYVFLQNITTRCKLIVEENLKF